jgi:hypothetical protein
MSELTAEILARPESSVGVALKRIENAPIIWIASEENLREVRCCAVRILRRTHQREATEVGWADRYGGAGLGNNGGAGRGAIVNGYYVKGIGRTPLLGRGKMHGHSNGFLFLEEAVRECVFGSIFAIELPWGAARPLAVIDTWGRPSLRHEVPQDFLSRAVLVVRQNVLRPAHLERAVLYQAAAPFAGALDEIRVQANIESAIEKVGRDALLEAYIEFWCRWSEQVAYQFIHRISQSLPATSNTALDGRLLDFGAARTSPSWGAYVLGPGLPSSGQEFETLQDFLMNGGVDVIRRIAPEESADCIADHVRGECARRYTETIAIEALRLLGLRREAATKWLSNPGAHERLNRVLWPIISRSQKYCSYEVLWPEDEWHWSLSKIWDQSIPKFLRPLREIAEDIAKPREPVINRSKFRLRSRPRLNYDALRSEIFSHFHDDLGDTHHRGRFASFVCRTIVENRRDSRVEPLRGTPIGFAASLTQSFALFEVENQIFAASELDRKGHVVQSPCLQRVNKLTADELVFDGGPAWDLTSLERI